MSNETDKKIKLYKNPARQESVIVKQYVPQYQQMGIAPEIINSNPVSSNVLVAREGITNSNNPRTRTPSIRQPYADPVGSKLGNSSVPNVGNSLEHTWVGVDGDIIDDISEIDSNHLMIDNNDIVDIETETKPDSDNLVEKDISNDIFNLPEDSYILLVNGEVFSVASKEKIEELASAFIFGEHELCDGQPIPIDNIIVLKKVKIKTGLFLE